MLQSVIRWISLMLGVVILAVLGAIIWGKQFDPFHAIYIQHGTGVNTINYTILDFDSHISYSATNTNSYYLSPNGRWEIRDEWIDEQLHIHIRSPHRLNFRLLGIYDIPTLPQVQWASDSESLLLVYKPVGEDVVIEQIDIATGEAELLNTYEFSGTLRFVYILNEQFIVLMGNLNSLIINSANDALVRLDETYIVAPPSADGHHVAYGETARMGVISADESNLHILDLETFETTSFNAEDFGGAILGNMQWSPTEAILPIADVNNHIILYDAETQTQRQLSPEYQMYTSFGAWSPDGTRMIVVKRLNNEEVAYVILNLETGEEVQLLTVDNRVTNTPSFYYSQQLRWSPDNRYIFSQATQVQVRSQVIFDIYDAETGDIVYSVDEEFDFSARNSYISWWWNS